MTKSNLKQPIFSKPFPSLKNSSNPNPPKAGEPNKKKQRKTKRLEDMVRISVRISRLKSSNRSKSCAIDFGRLFHTFRGKMVTFPMCFLLYMPIFISNVIQWFNWFCICFFGRLTEMKKKLMVGHPLKVDPCKKKISFIGEASFLGSSHWF